MEYQVAEEGTSLADIDVARPVHMEATQWDSVATWTWDVPSETCAICKNSLATMCVGCMARAGGNGSVSPSRPVDTGDAVAEGNTSTATPPPMPSSVAVATASAGPVTAATPPPGDGSPHPAPPARADPKATDISYVASVMASLKTGMNEKTYGNCAIAWGLCGHVFHAHCVSKWLTTRQACPVCGKHWEVYKLTTND